MSAIPDSQNLLSFMYPQTFNESGGVYQPPDRYVDVMAETGPAQGECEIIVANPSLGAYMWFHANVAGGFTLQDQGALDLLSAQQRQWNASMNPVLHLALYSQGSNYVGSGGSKPAQTTPASTTPSTSSSGTAQSQYEQCLQGAGSNVTKMQQCESLLSGTSISSGSGGVKCPPGQYSYGTNTCSKPPASGE